MDYLLEMMAGNLGEKGGVLESCTTPDPASATGNPTTTVSLRQVGLFPVQSFSYAGRNMLLCRGFFTIETGPDAKIPLSAGGPHWRHGGFRAIAAGDSSR